MGQGGGGGPPDNIPELIAEEQAEDKRDAEAADPVKQTFPELLEMFEKAHPRHAFVFFFLGGRLGKFGRLAAATRGGNERGAGRIRLYVRRTDRQFMRSFAGGSFGS